MDGRAYELLRWFARRFPILRGIGGTPLGVAILRKLRLPIGLAVASLEYETYRLARIEECRTIYPDDREEGLLSFITSVWNTDAAYIKALAESLARQQGGIGFEWLILDNGSTRRETCDCLQTLKSLPFVRLERVQHNLGITGGMRYLLERATGRYVLPLDSDDLLYPQCVSIFTHAIRKHNYPELLYSDEDKLEGSMYRDAYCKPDWDPVLFIHSCYIAHLCAIDRRLALSLGVYDDPKMEGCHDWDTFLRFYRAGHHPVHIPEVLYSWRMHPQSTAANIDSKAFIYESHVALQNKFLDAANLPAKYAIEASPLFHKASHWRFRRLSGRTPPLRTILMTDSPTRPRIPPQVGGYPGYGVDVAMLADGLMPIREFASGLAAIGGLVHLLWDQVDVQGDEWLMEAVQLMELFPDTAMVGGRIWSGTLNIHAAGAYFGFGKGCDAPDRGRPRGDPGYFGQMWKPHSVSAVSSQHAVVDAAFLVAAIDTLEAGRTPATPAYLGAWLGAQAKRSGRRIIYSPFLAGQALSDWESRVSEEERNMFVSLCADAMPDKRFLSSHLGLDPDTAYMPVNEERRRVHLAQLKVSTTSASWTDDARS